MKKCISVLLLATVALSACTDKDTAVRVLSGAGYKNIKITGYRFFGCGERDFYHTGFYATGVDGSGVTGVVCAGMLFKNSTIRLD